MQQNSMLEQKLESMEAKLEYMREEVQNYLVQIEKLFQNRKELENQLQ